MTNTTKAAVLHGPEIVSLQSLMLPPPADGQVLLTNICCSIDDGDVAKWRGDEQLTAPARLGSEVGGIVGAVGRGVVDLSPGDEVGAWTRPGQRFGGLADRTIVDARYCVRAPRTRAWAVVPVARAILAVIATRPLIGPLSSGMTNPLQRHGYKSEPRRSIAVVGTGAAARFVTALSALERPRSLIVLGRDESGLRRARELGATVTINASGRLSADAEAALAEHASHVDVVYRGLAGKHGVELALRLARRGGAVSMLGVFGAHANWGVRGLDDIVRGCGVSILAGDTLDFGVAELPPGDDPIVPAMRLAADFITRHVVNVAAMCDLEPFSLAQLREALSTAAADGAGTVVVDSTL